MIIILHISLENDLKCIIKFTDQTLYNVHKNILSLLKNILKKRKYVYIQFNFVFIRI